MKAQILTAMLAASLLMAPAWSQDDDDTGGDEGGSTGQGGDTGGGEPIDPLIRSQMEERSSNTIFDDVRVHSDSNSQAANDQIDARAMTHGNNVHFGADGYNPEEGGGRALLAHELTHTIQQGQQSQSSDAEEAEEKPESDEEDDSRRRGDQRERPQRPRRPD
jgi:hypothetical protein